MVATVRCDEISHEKYDTFMANEVLELYKIFIELHIVLFIDQFEHRYSHVMIYHLVIGVVSIKRGRAVSSCGGIWEEA